MADDIGRLASVVYRDARPLPTLGSLLRDAAAEILHERALADRLASELQKYPRDHAIGPVLDAWKEARACLANPQ